MEKEGGNEGSWRKRGEVKGQRWLARTRASHLMKPQSSREALLQCLAECESRFNMGRVMSGERDVDLNHEWEGLNSRGSRPNQRATPRPNQRTW